MYYLLTATYSEKFICKIKKKSKIFRMSSETIIQNVQFVHKQQDNYLSSMKMGANK